MTRTEARYPAALPGMPHGKDAQVLAAVPGVTNACALARNFYDADIDVVMTDVLTPASSLLYQRLLPECLIVHFHISFVEAQRRAATRKVFLTDAEFEQLHHADRLAPPPADRHLEVDHLTRSAQIRAVDEWWRTADH